jgi:hypothetical protein
MSPTHGTIVSFLFFLKTPKPFGFLKMRFLQSSMKNSPPFAKFSEKGKMA